MTTRNHFEDFDPYDGEGADNYARPQDWQARRSAGAFLIECLVGSLLAGFFVFYVAPWIARWFA